LNLSYLFPSPFPGDSSTPWNPGFMCLRWWTVSKISVMSYYLYNTLSSECIFLKHLQDILYLHIIWIPSTVMFYTTVFILTDNCKICLTLYCWLLCRYLEEEIRSNVFQIYTRGWGCMHIYSWDYYLLESKCAVLL
jgi:hypothetical protein